MLIRIKITKVPLGFAPDHIREAWVGLEMPAKQDDGEMEWDGGENAGGYVVDGVDAVNALVEAGQREAAEFWGHPIPQFSKLCFGADYCEVIEQKSTTGESIEPDSVREALQKLAQHKLHARMKEVSGTFGNEAHRILPEIWPIIRELCLIADASEAGMLEVKS